jgi:hypothetical protein
MWHERQNHAMWSDRYSENYGMWFGSVWDHSLQKSQRTVYKVPWKRGWHRWATQFKISKRLCTRDVTRFTSQRKSGKTTRLVNFVNLTARFRYVGQLNDRRGIWTFSWERGEFSRRSTFFMQSDDSWHFFAFRPRWWNHGVKWIERNWSLLVS